MKQIAGPAMFSSLRLIRSVSVTLTFALSLTPSAQAQSENALALAGVLEAQGCSYSLDGDPAPFAALEFDVDSAFEELMGLGLLRIQNNEAVVTTGACAEQIALGEAPETLVATLRALRDHDCAVTEAEFADFAAPIAARDVVIGHLRELDEVGFATLSSEARGVVLADNLCQASDAGLEGFAAQVPQLQAGTPIDRLPQASSPLGAAVLLTDRVVAEGCTVPREVEREVIASLEVVVFDVVIPLIEADLVQDGTPEFPLSDAFCALSLSDRRSALREVFAGN